MRPRLVDPRAVERAVDDIEYAALPGHGLAEREESDWLADRDERRALTAAGRAAA